MERKGGVGGGLGGGARPPPSVRTCAGRPPRPPTHTPTHPNSKAAAIQHLPALLAADPGVRLVIVDSVAFHVRAAPRGAGPAARARALAADGARLARVAREYGVAVVVTNPVAADAARWVAGPSPHPVAAIAALLAAS